MAKDKGQRPVHNIVQVAIQCNNNNNNNNNFFSNFIILFLRNKSIHTMYRTKHSHSLSKGMRGWTGEVKY